jgi:hypothetical protein
MRKRTHTPTDVEIKNFERRLDQSDELTKQLLIALKGSASMNIQGALPLLEELRKDLKEAVTDVSDLKRWRKIVEESKGTVSIKASVFLTRVLQVIGGAGVIASIAVAVMHLIDWLKKQGLLALLTE